MNDDSDDLIVRARDGDHAALSELVREHTERLLRVVRTELGDRLRQRVDSQDVVQQVYLDALRRIGEFRDSGDDAFFRWLRAIALNRIRDVDRRAFQTIKRGAEVRVGDVDLDASLAQLFERVAASVTTPSGVVDRRDRVRLLHRAIERLSLDQQEAIHLRYLRHQSVAEAATRMGRSERAVRGLCVRALIRLREVLGDAV